ncbi:hypothetical protein BX666DRAFT_1862354, partial [Dichotomocladium elegans]
LTAKLCWLLRVCGFMRPSDIEQIDLDQSDPAPVHESFHLVVVVPKEKRLGQRIHKNITISRHADLSLCPVQAFETYYQQYAREPCRIQHPVLSTIVINYLFRKINNTSKPIGAQRISKYISSIMSRLPQPPGHKRIKAQALGPTRATQAGATIDDVVSHGFWNSQQVFDTFYRLSRESNTGFTTLTLGSQDRSNAEDTIPGSIDNEG